VMGWVDLLIHDQVMCFFASNNNCCANWWWVGRRRMEKFGFCYFDVWYTDKTHEIESDRDEWWSGPSERQIFAAKQAIIVRKLQQGSLSLSADCVVCFDSTLKRKIVPLIGSATNRALISLKWGLNLIRNCPSLTNHRVRSWEGDKTSCPMNSFVNSCAPREKDW
jgi:hypothetical protein